MADGLTVIIPSCGRIDILKENLTNILDCPEFTAGQNHIIIIDDSPGNLCASLKAVFLHKPISIVSTGGRRGPSFARNLGAKLAQSKLIAFIDDDVIVSQGWLAAGVAAMAAYQETVGVVGPIVLPDDKPADYFSHFTNVAKPGAYPAGNIWFRRDLFLACGGFDEDFFDPLTGMFHHEDSAAAFRALKVGPILYVPEMLVFHPAHSRHWLTPIRRGKKAIFEALLHRKYPVEYDEKGAVRLGPLYLRRLRVRVRVAGTLGLLAVIATRHIGIVLCWIALCGIVEVIYAMGIQNAMTMRWRLPLAMMGGMAFQVSFTIYWALGCIKFRHFVL